MDELSEELFWFEAYSYIRRNVVMTTYLNMSEDTRGKLRSKMIIDICKEFAPRRNYNIPKSEIGKYVEKTLVDWEAELAD